VFYARAGVVERGVLRTSGWWRGVFYARAGVVERGVLRTRGWWRGGVLRTSGWWRGVFYVRAGVVEERGVLRTSGCGGEGLGVFYARASGCGGGEGCSTHERVRWRGVFYARASGCGGGEGCSTHERAGVVVERGCSTTHLSAYTLRCIRASTLSCHRTGVC